MASIAESSARGRKLLESGQWKYVTPEAQPTLPPPAAYPPAPNQYLRAPLPPDMWQQPDAQRQFHIAAIPQIRLSPLPDNTNPVSGAQAASQAIAVVSGITNTPSAGLAGATSVSFTTGTLSVNTSQTGTVNIAKTFALLNVQVSSASRMRLYSTAASRDTAPEPTRPISVAVTPGLANGIICDFNLTGLPGVPLNFPCSPVVTGANQDAAQSSTIYYSVTNLGGSPAAITGTLIFVQLEAA